MRFRDWIGKHFGPGPALDDVLDDFDRLRHEWADMQDYLNRWAAKNAKRKSRETREILAQALPPEQPDEQPDEQDQLGDRKQELRRRAFQLRTGTRGQ